MVGCYHSQCTACCCAGSAGSALPHWPCLLHETCSHGTDQQREEEKVNRRPAADGRGILHTVTGLIFSVDSLLRTNCFKLTIFQLYHPWGNLKTLLSESTVWKSVTSRCTPCMDYWTLIRTPLMSCDHLTVFRWLMQTHSLLLHKLRLLTWIYRFGVVILHLSLQISTPNLHSLTSESFYWSASVKTVSFNTFFKTVNVKTAHECLNDSRVRWGKC